MNIDLNTQDKHIVKKIKNSVGQTIEFSNGCWLNMVEDNGVFWGVTPYGQDWCCNVDINFVDVVFKWVLYWNEPRSENGQLLDNFLY